MKIDLKALRQSRERRMQKVRQSFESGGYKEVLQVGNLAKGSSIWHLRQTNHRNSRCVFSSSKSPTNNVDMMWLVILPHIGRLWFIAELVHSGNCLFVLVRSGASALFVITTTVFPGRTQEQGVIQISSVIR